MKAWELADRLDAAADADSVWQLGLSTLRSLGIDNALWMRFAGASPPLVRSDAPPNWLAGYGQKVQAAGGDPFVTHCLSRIAPIRTGLDYMHLHWRISAPEQALIIEACEETGTRTGTSITTARNRAGWSLGTDAGVADFEALMMASGADIALCAQVIDTALDALSAPAHRVRPLSPRERDCLTYVATGHRVGQIADRLGISETTVEFHLRNARGKLQAATRDEAVARALIAGEIAI